MQVMSLGFQLHYASECAQNQNGGATMYTIYGFFTFNAAKVLLTAEELGLDYEYIALDPTKGENKRPEHLARHPFGKIPVLEHNGNTFIESASICRYLSNVNGKRLYSDDPVKAAHIDQTVDMMAQHIGRWMASYFWQEIVCNKLMGKDVDTSALAEADGFLKQQLPYIDGLLGQNAYLCGDELTLADIQAFAYCQIQEKTSLDLSAYQNLMNWYGKFSERASVAKVNPMVSL